MRHTLLAFCLFVLLGGFFPRAEAAGARFVPIGPDDGSVELLATDPAAPLTLLAVGRHSGDLYRSLDGGVSWTSSNAGLQQAVTVTPNPRRPGLFYAVTASGLLHRSGDARTYSLYTYGSS